LHHYAFNDDFKIKQKTVIVFGKDSNEISMKQLEQLRDYLISMGYEASLPMMVDL
jgi:hypothetical protein